MKCETGAPCARGTRHNREWIDARMVLCSPSAHTGLIELRYQGRCSFDGRSWTIAGAIPSMSIAVFAWEKGGVPARRWVGG